MGCPARSAPSTLRLKALPEFRNLMVVECLGPSSFQSDTSQDPSSPPTPMLTRFLSKFSSSTTMVAVRSASKHAPSAGSSESKATVAWGAVRSMENRHSAHGTKASPQAMSLMTTRR